MKTKNPFISKRRYVRTCPSNILLNKARIKKVQRDIYSYVLFFFLCMLSCLTMCQFIITISKVGYQSYTHVKETTQCILTYTVNFNL